MNDLTLLHPRLQLKAAQIKEQCEKQGISIRFSEGLRTKQEQDALYAQGRTAPGSIVTNAKGSTYSSQHQWGIAVDFYLNMDIDKDGSAADDAFNNSTGIFDRVGSIAKAIGLGWGGDWQSIKDRPHVYLPDWGNTTSKLKQLYQTPENFRKTWDGNIQAASKEEDTPSASYPKKQFIREIQSAIGANIDGIAGSETLRKTVTLSASKNRKHAAVKPVQKYLASLSYPSVGAADGIAGNKFTAAVKAYQKDHGCVADGEITAQEKTWKSLLGML